MSVRPAWLAAALLCFSLPALLAFVSSPAGTGSCSMAKGATCFSDFTAAGADAISTSVCGEIKVVFRSDVADATNNDGLASIYCCPAGVTTVTAACGKAIPYLYLGTTYTTLTGDTGRDALYGLVCQNLVADVTTVESTKTARIQVDCR